MTLWDLTDSLRGNYHIIVKDIDNDRLFTLFIDTFADYRSDYDDESPTPLITYGPKHIMTITCYPPQNVFEPIDMEIKIYA